MIYEDFHVHTCFCDGKNTPEDIVLSAITKGMKKLGFSGHVYTPFDNSYCMSFENMNVYKKTITELKEKYKDSIEILCGLEMDYYADYDPSEYDYTIGSVHYINVENEYIPIDENADIVLNAIEKYFCGDPYAYAEKYFSIEADVIRKTNADVIGHFDLLTKFNERTKMFDVTAPRFVRAYTNALDVLLKTGRPFEINMGAISRGYRTDAYPDTNMLKYIYDNGGHIILSSDSHQKDTLMYEFERFEATAKNIGFSPETVDNFSYYIEKNKK